MVVIYDPLGREESFALRDNIRRAAIPCAVMSQISSFEDAFACLYAADIADPTELSAFCDKEKLTPFFRDLLTDHDNIRLETERVINRIYDLLFVKYGINPDFHLAERFVDNQGRTKYATHRIGLTETERLIARYLTCYADKWKSAADIISFCLKDTATSALVSVHITKMNSKADMYSSIPFIETKRGYGYRFKIRK